MSGQHVPYQLRTNKFVERLLFVDVLDHVRLWNGPTRYVYASMGGLFLEDFKLINDRFAIEKMVSIEEDEWTWRRQQFNCPFGFVECRHQTSEEFVVNFDQLASDSGDMRFIVWLDYAAANDRGKQLQEYRDLVSKLASGDVIKITVNANLDTVRDKTEFRRQLDFQRAVMYALGEQLDEYMPAEPLAPEKLAPHTFASYLALAIKDAALKGIAEDRTRSILPLSAFRYRDGFHQMLTVTAIIVDDALNTTIDKDSVFANWPFRADDWDSVKMIDIPDLSPRERATINAELTKKNDFKLHEDLPFRLDPDDNESLRLLKNYLVHYRRYPGFGRVGL